MTPMAKVKQREKDTYFDSGMNTYRLPYIFELFCIVRKMIEQLMFCYKAHCPKLLQIIIEKQEIGVIRDTPASFGFL